MLPPRRQWPRAGLKRRVSTSDDVVRARSELLARDVLQALRNPKRQAPWTHRLRKFILEIQSTASTWSRTDRFVPVKTIAIPKGRSGTGQKYRLVSIYSLRDTILASGFSAYFRALLEPRLGVACLAYRAATPGKRPVSHHDAVARIKKYASGYPPNAPLWVAECDLKGFFDNLRHSTVRRTLRRLFRPSNPDDESLREFIESFLSGYSFAAGVDDASGRLASSGVYRPNFGRPLAIGDTRTGVAQGSAISCILANAVLFPADDACTQEQGPNALFLRYSDDTLFISPDRAECQAMLDAYLHTLSHLRLPAHPPEAHTAYNRKFWSGKSKSPYKWVAAGPTGAVPWLAFVGYHVARNLQTRARPSSVDKELNKQRQVADLAVSRIVRASKRVPRLAIRRVDAIRFRALQHMLAFGVGQPRAKTPAPIPGGLSWTRGFKELKGSQAALRGLANLDRGRLIALNRVSGRIKALVEARICYEGKFPARRTIRFRLKYPGRPFSYARQFI
ncbi:reverse transcriptase domain-containing protein [Archangium violaceum]|uniref:reverse transcriptase domain-containing protein n=1 Tax=Archangium violaceum TaxID=83451 RepID=UPI0036DE22E8